ncbi:MAG: glucosamine-6-phosphate deaminase [Candidatus Levybacteria bacterium]|nr:glucosamine-6-phosphate deaminase [Candidatus Levybacteria bacterium]
MTAAESRIVVPEGRFPEPSSVTYPPELVVLPNAEAVDAYAAGLIIEQIRTKPTSVLTLPTGNTPIGMYGLIVASAQEGIVNLSKTTIVNLDEYHPIDPASLDSYASFMRRHLMDHVPVGEWNIPNGGAPSADEEAQRYRALLEARQPVDLAVVGIGPGTTCHIGFNEKGSEPDSTVRYVTLDLQTREANARLFEDPSQIPEGALTQGIGDILRARWIILIAKGVHKAWGVNRTLKGPVSSDAPASFLRIHPRVTAVLDQEAAQYLLGN